MRISELRKMMKQVIDVQQVTVDALAYERHNPTVRDDYNRAVGELDMARAVLAAIENDRLQLKLRAMSPVLTDGVNP